MKLQIVLKACSEIMYKSEKIIYICPVPLKPSLCLVSITNSQTVSGTGCWNIQIYYTDMQKRTFMTAYLMMVIILICFSDSKKKTVFEPQMNKKT